MRLYSAYTVALCVLGMALTLGGGAQTAKQKASNPSVSVSVVPQNANRDRTLTGHTDYVSALAFSPDSRRLLTGSVDMTAIVWDAATGRKLLTLKGMEAGSMTQFNEHEGLILAGAISSNGTLGATGGARGKYGEAKLWDIKARRPAPEAK